jgi:hypothetical protein
MSKMNEKADSMAKTITNIDNIKRLSAQENQMARPKVKEFEYEGYTHLASPEVHESQMMRSGVRYGYKPSMISAQEESVQKFKKQDKFEKSVINTLPKEYQHAKLIEITESSYLIRNEVRLPIFGRSARMHERKRHPRDPTLLMQNLDWKKNTRPISHSTIKEIEEEKTYFKENNDLKTDQDREESKMEESPARRTEDLKDDESMGRIDVKVPRPGDSEYDRIQDQNQAIKKLIINVDNLIHNFYNNPEKFKESDDLEDLIRNMIEKEILLSDSEKKTIEVLVIDYLRNDKSVLDLIRLDKLEEDFRSQQYDDDRQSQYGSEDKASPDMLWNLTNTEQYMDLLTQRLPNKYERITEIKYKIPMKWTKKFNIDDIVPHREKLETAIINEGGMVNNYMKMKRKLQNKKMKHQLSESVQPPTSQFQNDMMQEISTPHDTTQFPVEHSLLEKKPFSAEGMTDE